ncbi:signal transduction histidine kinase [Gloeopeniophorella convolvens]|nr:signal transduction histidine kinase [Gloeopeniophorella convolvens]
MPSFPTPSSPISPHPGDDARPSPAPPSLGPSSPSARKASPAPAPPVKPTLPVKADPGPPPPATKEVCTFDDAIDRDVFEQILDLDEDGEQFSKDMVDAYFAQADKTFAEMDAALSKKDLTELSVLGHFLKGSSAALGLSKVQASCQDIQHFGQLRDRQGDGSLTDVEAIAKINVTLARAREEYAVAKGWLEDFYGVED